MSRLGHGLDWLVDRLLPNALLAAIGAGWLAAVTVVAVKGPWWGAVLAALLGVPFVAAVVAER